MKKSLRILTWILMGLSLVLFWVSLRSKVNQVEYTWAALACWGMAFAVNYFLKRENKK